MPQLSRARRQWLVAAGYLAAMAFWIYAVVEPQVGYGSATVDVVLLVGLATLHLATGWLIGRWWAVLLPAMAVPLAVPAGTPQLGEDPLPIWFGIAVFLGPLGAAAVGLAVAVRRLALEPSRR